MTDGSIYRQLREQAGLSQAEVAEKADDISQQSISAYENGKAIPSFDKVVQLAEIYGVSVDAFAKDKKKALG